MRVQFCKNILIADNFCKVSGPDLSVSARLTIRIHRAASEEGRDRRILSATNSIRPIVAVVVTEILLLTPLLFLLKLFCGVDNTCCDPAKGAPDHGTGPESPSGIFAGESDERITATLATSHGIRKTENVCDGVTSGRVAKTQWAGGETARKKFATKSADRGASKKGIVGRVRGSTEREIGEHVRMTRRI